MLHAPWHTFAITVLNLSSAVAPAGHTPVHPEETQYRELSWEKQRCDPAVVEGQGAAGRLWVCLLVCAWAARHQARDLGCWGCHARPSYFGVRRHTLLPQIVRGDPNIRRHAQKLVFWKLDGTVANSQGNSKMEEKRQSRLGNAERRVKDKSWEPTLPDQGSKMRQEIESAGKTEKSPTPSRGSALRAAVAQCPHSRPRRVPARPACRTGVSWGTSFLQGHRTTPAAEHHGTYLQTSSAKAFLTHPRKVLWTNRLPMRLLARSTKLPRGFRPLPALSTPSFLPPAPAQGPPHRVCLYPLNLALVSRGLCVN